MRPSPLAPGRIGAAVILALFCLSVCGCIPGKDEGLTPGVAATVDGRPISLRQLEFHYDVVMLGGMSDNASVAQLETGYGASLGELIVQALAEIALERAGQPVTGEEVQKAMDRLRQDYPEGAFGHMLAEEAVDQGDLRQCVKGRIAVEKLARVVLRPKVSISPEEAMAYYQANAASFGRPARVKLAVVRGATREETRKNLEAYRKAQSAGTAPGAFVREVAAAEDKIPQEWREALKKLKPGESSPALAGAPGFVVLVFLERIAAKPADPVTAYPRVEEALLAVKMRQAFADWFAKASKEARITVNPALLRPSAETPGEFSTPEPEADKQKVLPPAERPPLDPVGNGSQSGPVDYTREK